MAEFARKLKRIRKTCGDGVPLKEIPDFADKNSEDEGEELDGIAEELVDNLDDDWDPDAHDKLVKKLFDNEDYYAAETGDDALDDDDDEGDTDKSDLDDYIPGQVGMSIL